MNSKTAKHEKKISIVLPEIDEIENAAGSASMPRQTNDGNDAKKSFFSNTDLSVTSYVLQHSKRKSRGNYVPQVCNELSSFIHFNEATRVHASPRGWVGKDTRRKGAPKNIEIEKVRKLKTTTDDKEDVEDREIESPSPESITPPSSISASSFLKEKEVVTSNKPPFPVIAYQRPQVATKKGIIDYSDLPLLRKQIAALTMTHNNAKYRKDFARTSHDIYRLKLNRPETTTVRFRDVCVTYLSTSPGASSAITGQLG